MEPQVYVIECINDSEELYVNNSSYVDSLKYAETFDSYEKASKKIEAPFERVKSMPLSVYIKIIYSH